MVKIMENPIKMDDLGVTIIFGNTHIHVEGITGRMLLLDVLGNDPISLLNQKGGNRESKTYSFAFWDGIGHLSCNYR